MSLFRNIFLLLLIIILFNSCISSGMPVYNPIASNGNGENKVSLSINSMKLFEPTNDFPQLLSISYWKKIDKDTSYEFYLLGLRRIANIYRNGAFYLDNFISIHSLLFINGGNIGFTTGLNFKHFNIYTSTKFEPFMFFTPSIEGSESGVESFMNLSSVLGISYTFKSFSLFLEALAIVWNKESDKLKDSQFTYKQPDYMISLGVSF